ncbi:MAG: Gfo/Idh/MocA family oxidoreductase [Lachnospiraceae bacterium]|nr:Gfo/Idh/MocA family oxidoreductase [Lachnospiraceae bacterium]
MKNRNDYDFNIGIICPSEIATRRFLPALVKSDFFSFKGIAAANASEWFGESLSEVSEIVIKQTIDREVAIAKAISREYGCEFFGSYQEIIEAPSIDAVYIPLPPALHFKWAAMALRNGKHVFVEKPATTALVATDALIILAQEKNLALHENYMFTFHNQLNEISQVVKSGKLGDIRLYRLSFGFPRRDKSDFRYSKALGGGALLDCGGYTLKYAKMLLGQSACIVSAVLNHSSEFNVDLYGAATLVNDIGQTLQLSFGMDNSYKCELEIWGSKGSLVTGRILTAPPDFKPTYEITSEAGREIRELPADDSFHKSLEFFEECINNAETRVHAYEMIRNQAALVEEFQSKALLY